jgi:hypothetical protein
VIGVIIGVFLVFVAYAVAEWIEHKKGGSM